MRTECCSTGVGKPASTNNGRRRLHRRFSAPVGETGNLAQAWVRRPLAQHVLRHQLMTRERRVGEYHGVDERHPIDDLAEEIGRRSHRDRPGGRLGDERARSAASNTTASECDVDLPVPLPLGAHRRHVGPHRSPLTQKRHRNGIERTQSGGADSES